MENTGNNKPTNQTNQKRMSFLEYLQKTKDAKKRMKNVKGCEGTTIRVVKDSIVEHRDVNPSSSALEYAVTFTRAKENESDQNSKKQDKDEGREPGE